MLFSCHFVFLFGDVSKVNTCMCYQCERIFIKMKEIGFPSTALEMNSYGTNQFMEHVIICMSIHLENNSHFL